MTQQQANSATELEVYWRPHCSSCQKVKEFLAQNGVAYRSINAEADPAALTRLQSLGIRGVPVLTRGRDWVYAQSLDDVARFCGIARNGEGNLEINDLTRRGIEILRAAARLVRRSPVGAFNEEMSGRQRSGRELAHHLFRVSELFLEAAHGADFTYEKVAADLPSELRDASPEQIADYGDEVTLQMVRWSAAAPSAHPSTVYTFYGERPLVELLERTVWHSGHHARQLREMLAREDIAAAAFFPDYLLDGLPAPQAAFG